MKSGLLRVALHLTAVIAAMFAFASGIALADAPAAGVTVLRVPDAGIQPQVGVDAKGTVHLIYFKGPEGRGDIFYVRSTDDGRTFSAPIRVNFNAGSAIAIGSMRGAHLAVGKNGRVHVAWMGSDEARPRAVGNATPMMYTRMNDAGTGFEPERNVLQEKVGLDGGGSVAADGLGNVYVAWHAPAKRMGDEASRQVWVARSIDDGKTFAGEVAAWDGSTGGCGCCGMRMFADAQGGTYILYRSATESIHRDMFLLTSPAPGAAYKGTKVGPWETGKCEMSTAAFTGGATGVYAAWEQEGQIYWARTDRREATGAPGEHRNRKHPAIASNAAGQVLLAWAEGTGWQRGGTLVWQVFDATGKPVAAQAGRADGLPVWSLPAAFSTSKGEFVVMY